MGSIFQLKPLLGASLILIWSVTFSLICDVLDGGRVLQMSPLNDDPLRACGGGRNTRRDIMATATDGRSQSGAPGSAGAGGLGGKTTIEDSVVAKIAGMAARDVPGVHALGGGAARVVGAIREALNSADLTQGISVEVGEQQVAVDVTIVAEYPVALQQVADGVRTAIFRAMQELVGMDVTEVNVTVNDVHMPAEDEEEQAQGARVQ
jgi:uncharacterized alkaline shock family protein YloU